MSALTVNINNLTKKNLSKIIKFLKSGKIGVLPTDTIYGLHSSIYSPAAIERLYRLRKRSPKKPMIILISSLKDLEIFNIKLTNKEFNFLKKVWPNKVSVILPFSGKGFEYLHRGTKTLAFRLPDHKLLLRILKKTGPLVSTSVNLEGKPSAENIAQAKKYFGSKIDFYVDAGKIKSLPSTVIKFNDNKTTTLRQSGSSV